MKLKLTIKDSSNPLHSLFRWFLLIFYKENPEMYNWSEFKVKSLKYKQETNSRKKPWLRSCKSSSILKCCSYNKFRG